MIEILSSGTHFPITVINGKQYFLLAVHHTTSIQIVSPFVYLFSFLPLLLFVPFFISFFLFVLLSFRLLFFRCFRCFRFFVSFVLIHLFLLFIPVAGYPQARSKTTLLRPELRPMAYMRRMHCTVLPATNPLSANVNPFPFLLYT